MDPVSQPTPPVNNSESNPLNQQSTPSAAPPTATAVDTSQSTVSPASAINGAVVGSGFDPASIPGPKRSKKKLLMLIAGVVVLLGAVAVVVFAWYLPNRPEAVWDNGLNRTGKALDTFVTEATDKKKLDLLSKVETSGSIDASSSDIKFKGTFSSKYDPRHSMGALNLSYTSQGAPEKKLSTQFLAELPDGSDYPDVYLQFAGLKTLLPPEYTALIGDYDGKWISIDSNYLKSLVATSGQASPQKVDFTQADSAEMAHAVVNPTNEYVLTSKSDKAVFVRKKVIGSETVEGVGTYHYTVGLDKEHVKNYCDALINSITSTNAFKKLPSTYTASFNKASVTKDCRDSADNIKDGDTFDLWMDKKTKLIHKVRITDNGDSANYVDIGQNFKGGDEIPFFVTFHSDKDKYDGKLNLTLNNKDNTTKGTFTYNGSGSSKTTVNAQFTIKPYSGEVTINKPTNAIPIQDILKKIGLDPTAFVPSTPSSTAL